MIKRINFKIFLGSYFVLFVLFLINVFLYEQIRMETADFGIIVNSLILGLTSVFQFPFNAIMQPSLDIVFFIGLLINIAIYTMTIYFFTKALLNYIKRNKSN
jgi:hypothetical protein